MNIAVLGIGQMGYLLGRRLCDAGLTVHAWNRTHQQGRATCVMGRHHLRQRCPSRACGRLRSVLSGQRICGE